MNKFAQPGVEDILIAACGRAQGLSRCINAAFPETTVQTCICPLVRHSLNFCDERSRRTRKKPSADFIKATDVHRAEKGPCCILSRMGQKLPVHRSSCDARARKSFPSSLPPAVRKIHSTRHNAIESLNRVIPKNHQKRA